MGFYKMKILTIDYQVSDASKQFIESLKNSGFAVLNNHPIDTTKIFQAYKAWEAFFNSEEKKNYLFEKETQDGFFPFLSENAKTEEVADLKEFYHFYLWGKQPPHLSELTSELYVALNKLAFELLTWIEKELPDEIVKQLSMPLSKMAENSPRTLLRVLHYPPLTGAEAPGAVRAFDHEDINLITILPAATAPGLQVKDSQGNWINVPCDPGMIAINVGDMLQMVTQNYLPSTTHRVVNPEGELARQSRLSMPLFLHPCDDVVLSPTHTANQYREERLREIGLLD